jgi:hypothetical protein
MLFKPVVLVTSVLLMVFVVICITCITLAIPNNAAGYHEVVDTPYVGPTSGITIDYPGMWTVDDADEQEGIIIFTSNAHDTADMILETLDISTYPADGRTIVDFARFLAQDFYPSNLDSFDIVTEQPTSIGKKEAYLIVYDYYDKGLDASLRAMDVIISESGNYYLLGYTAAIEDYQLYLSIINQMVKSFDLNEDVTRGPGGFGGEDPTGGLGGFGENATGGPGGFGGEDPTGGLGGPLS